MNANYPDDQSSTQAPDEPNSLPPEDSDALTDQADDWQDPDGSEPGQATESGIESGTQAPGDQDQPGSLPDDTGAQTDRPDDWQDPDRPSTEQSDETGGESGIEAPGDPTRPDSLPDDTDLPADRPDDWQDPDESGPERFSDNAIQPINV